MTHALPPTDTVHPPAFADPAQCEAWIKTLPLFNPIQAQAQLLRQMNLLNRYALAGDSRLDILEALREPIHFTQGESAKKFSGKPLPLAPPEQAALDSSHALWQALALGYRHCLAACRAGDANLQLRAAKICQRALAALTEDQTALVRAGYQPDNAHWRQLHAVLAGAEALGVTTVAGEDGLRARAPISPATAYAEAMLLHAASLHELSPRQRTWAIRWARRWAGKVVVQAAVPAVDTPALPLCVDLDGDAPVGFKRLSGPGVRWLETTELRRSLKKRLKLLAEGGEDNTPAKLGLGDDCPQPMCGQVLRRIYPRWVKGGVLRRHERHPMSGACRLVVGVDAIHYFVSDHQPFKPPGSLDTDELRRQREELATFGRARFEEEYSRMHGFQLENWEVVEDWGMLDQSAGGVRMARPLKQEGGRVGIGQLVAVQPEGSSGLLLGVARWAQIVGDILAAGVQLIPGKPVPVAVRPAGAMAVKEPYRPGFLLPAVEALKLPASVVLPPGTFKPERIVETWAAGLTGEVRLKSLLDRGADFERAVCEDVVY